MLTLEEQIKIDEYNVDMVEICINSVTGIVNKDTSETIRKSWQEIKERLRNVPIR